MERISGHHTEERSVQAAVRHEAGGCPWPVPMLGRHGEDSPPEIVAVPCGRRRCPVCGPALYPRYVAHYLSVFRWAAPVYLVTLTTDPKCGCSQADDALGRMWKLLVQRLRRLSVKQGSTFRYVAVREQHDGGRVHIHAIVQLRLPEALVRHHWMEVKGGISCSVQELPTRRDKARAIAYIFKAMADPEDPKSRIVGRIMASEGVGYHSRAAKDRRDRWAREHGLAGLDGTTLVPLMPPRRPAADRDVAALPEADDSDSPWDRACPFPCRRTGRFTYRHADGRTVRWTKTPDGMQQETLSPGAVAPRVPPPLITIEEVTATLGWRQPMGRERSGAGMLARRACWWPTALPRGPPPEDASHLGHGPYQPPSTVEAA